MIRLCTVALAFVVVCTAVADQPAAPPLQTLEAIASISADSVRFAKFLEDYGFGENPKREGSWGSSFGVFLELDANRKVSVGIRPPSDATNLPTYSERLPRGLEAGDSIALIESKLGKPLKTSHDPKSYFQMNYDGLTVFTINGTLFEVWLTAAKNNAKPSSLRDSP